MKRMYDPSRIMELFVKIGLIAALAAVLLVPTTIRAHAGEAALSAEHGWPGLKRAAFGRMLLPPIPYLETMPWLGWQRSPAAFKIDTLLAPRFEMAGPEVAAAQTAIPLRCRATQGECPSG